MSKRKLNIEDKKCNYYIKEYLSDSETSDINIYSNIISNKSLFHVTNQNHSSHISTIFTKNIIKWRIRAI